MEIAESDPYTDVRFLYKLGKYTEALRELHNLGPEFQSRHEALQLRWSIFADQGRWYECIDIARTLTIQRPDDAQGWLHLADSIGKIPEGTVHMSYDILSSVVGRIREPILMLALARYSSQLGRIEEMREWIAKARAVVGGSGLNGAVRLQ